MPAWVKVTEDAWLKSANLASGTLFRSVAKTGNVWGSGFTGEGHLFDREKGSYRLRLRPCCTSRPPQDLCARLCHQAGGELEQIQFQLGHVSAPNDRSFACLYWSVAEDARLRPIAIFRFICNRQTRLCPSGPRPFSPL